MENIVRMINALLWGIPVLSLILITGVYLTITSKFAQIKLLPRAFRQLVRSMKGKHRQKSEESGYRALCTALAATVGTGNIAGVAGAIAIGGPGTVFWMWLCAIFGMITKLAEVTLAQRYRIRNRNGELVGGPMYIIQKALPSKFSVLAYIYAFLGIVAALGVGNATQINAVVEGLKNMAFAMNIELSFRGVLIAGGILIIFLLLAFHKGIHGVGTWAERMVPLASLSYIVMCFWALAISYKQVYPAVCLIIKGAFNPQSATCGLVSSALLTLRVGASRGVFTNEAGMGTASIAHAGATVDHPVEQGLMGIIEVFLDTILICTLTALVILSSGVHIPYGTDPGIALTLDAFSLVLGKWSQVLITGLVCIFAFATVLGWGVYGMRCAQFLLNESAWKLFIALQVFAAVMGIILNTSTVWMFSEVFNGLMSIPNLTVLFILSPEFLKTLNEYQEKKRTV